MKQAAMVQARKEPQALTMVQKALLVCGIVSTLLYAATDVLGGMRLTGYSHLDQMVSELSAVGAPTRPLMLASGIVYDTLVVVFGIGVWALAGKKRSLRVSAIALVAFGVIGWLGWLVPMNARGAERSATDLGHLVFGMASVLSMVLFIGSGSGADRRWFRTYSILTILATLVAGAWTGTQAARIAAGLPTPWGGAIERVAVYGPMLWILVLATVLLRAQKEQETLPAAAPEKAV
ncbi:MAG TPA: DUF998 domain-containing protein [Candidatus Aquicultor sp.]